MVFSSLAVSEDVATFFLADFFFAITNTPSLSWNQPPVSPPQPQRQPAERSDPGSHPSLGGYQEIRRVHGGVSCAWGVRIGRMRYPDKVQ